jgi:peptide/nickel transport system permease protein
MVNAVFAKDFPIVQGACLVIAVVVVLTNLIVDILYSWMDPRIRYN